MFFIKDSYIEFNLSIGICIITSVPDAILFSNKSLNSIFPFFVLSSVNISKHYFVIEIPRDAFLDTF